MPSIPARVLMKTLALPMCHASGHAQLADFVAFLRLWQPEQAGEEILPRQISPGTSVYVHGYTAHSVWGEVRG